MATKSKGEKEPMKDACGGYQPRPLVKSSVSSGKKKPKKSGK